MASWSQLTSESGKAYNAFRIYLELGRIRTYEETARQLRRSGSLIRRWGNQNNWVQRARDWDLEQDERRQQLKDEALQETVREEERDLYKARKRHAALAGAAMKHVANSLTNMKDEKLSPGQTIRWLEVSARLEEQARSGQVIAARTSRERNGEAKIGEDERVLVIDLEDLTDDQLAQFEKFAHGSNSA